MQRWLKVAVYYELDAEASQLSMTRHRNRSRADADVM